MLTCVRLTRNLLLSTGSESEETGLLESSDEDLEAADMEAVDPDDLSEDVGFASTLQECYPVLLGSCSLAFGRQDVAGDMESTGFPTRPV